MESNIVASRPKPSSASNQTTERIVENRISYDEIFATASNPKVFFLELAKNAQAAENNFDMAMRQWQEMKSRSQMETYDKKSENALSQSTSSYNSIKNVSSDNFAQKINEDEETRDTEEKPTDDSQLQIVLTPRTPREEEDEESPEVVEEAVVPIRAKNSLSSVKTTSKKPRKVKSKKKSQLARVNDEQLRTSLIYSAAKAKRKKLHGRLKNSNSKSTIATRDTNYSDKKVDRKKFKRQQSLDTMSAFQAPQTRKRSTALKARESRQLNSKADFIEIFHSSKAAAKSVGGGSVSSQMSKDVARTVAEAKKRKKQPPPPTVVEKNTVDVDPQIQVQDPFVSHLEREDKSNEQQHQQYQTNEQSAPPKACSSEVYDPFYPRNYELPTLASKMKRNHKPYYHHFNIRNIPFVVGTSLSPSHNLGLNIQQVLSIIKVKQPAVPGISPLLIRKVSRGVRPVSTLFEHISNQYARTYRNLSRRRSRSRQRIGSFSCEQLMQRASCSLGNPASSFKQNVMCEPLYEEDEDNQSTCSESRARNPQQQERYRSRKHHHHCQHSAENGCSYGAQPSNNKEITEVFTRLYDQFDKMVSQHERLKEQLEKRKDKALLKEVSELESAMTTKEQEITAVVNLYNEVTSLKKQMKLLHERNSFVCIATPDPSFQAVPSKIRAKTAPGPYLDAKPSRREMPNALKLVGLLRQMQAFQRQLALA